MMTHFSLLPLLLCLSEPDGMAQPFQEPATMVTRAAAKRLQSNASSPSSTSSGAKPWVRLVGQAEEDGRIVLQWRTNPAQPARSFRVERSTDGVTWDALGEVSGGEVVQKNGYVFTDDSPLRAGVYRLQCLQTDGSTLCSAVLLVVNPRRANQPVRYFTTHENAILVGLESTSLLFPVTANLYSEEGELICYDQLTKKVEEFRIDMPVTRTAAVKLQLVDHAHRVLAVRQIALPR